MRFMLWIDADDLEPRRFKDYLYKIDLARQAGIDGAYIVCPYWRMFHIPTLASAIGRCFELRPGLKMTDVMRARKDDEIYETVAQIMRFGEPKSYRGRILLDLESWLDAEKKPPRRTTQQISTVGVQRLSLLPCGPEYMLYPFPSTPGSKQIFEARAEVHTALADLLQSVRSLIYPVYAAPSTDDPWALAGWWRAQCLSPAPLVPMVWFGPGRLDPKTWPSMREDLPVRFDSDEAIIGPATPGTLMSMGQALAKSQGEHR